MCCVFDANNKSIGTYAYNRPLCIHGDDVQLYVIRKLNQTCKKQHRLFCSVVYCFSFFFFTESIETRDVWCVVEVCSRAVWVIFLLFVTAIVVVVVVYVLFCGRLTTAGIVQTMLYLRLAKSNVVLSNERNALLVEVFLRDRTRVYL